MYIYHGNIYSMFQYCIYSRENVFATSAFLTYEIDNTTYHLRSLRCCSWSKGCVGSCALWEFAFSGADDSPPRKSHAHKNLGWCHFYTTGSYSTSYGEIHCTAKCALLVYICVKEEYFRWLWGSIVTRYHTILRGWRSLQLPCWSVYINWHIT